MGFFDDDDKKSWKDCLSDEDRALLESMLSETKRFNCTVEKAENPEIARLWCYLIELTKEIRGLKEMLGKLQGPWLAIVSVGEAEKKRTIERLVTEMIRPTDADTQEATKKLVESLMKF